MSDDGSTKDDVKIPDGEVGDKIKKLFQEDGKDTSKAHTQLRSNAGRILTQGTDVIVLTAMGEECAIDAKEAPK
jgi:translation initiation factor 5A